MVVVIFFLFPPLSVILPLSAVSFFMLIGRSLFSYAGAELNSGTVTFCPFIISALFFAFGYYKTLSFFSKAVGYDHKTLGFSKWPLLNLFFICILFYTFVQ